VGAARAERERAGGRGARGEGEPLNRTNPRKEGNAKCEAPKFWTGPSVFRRKKALPNNHGRRGREGYKGGEKGEGRPSFLTGEI